MNADQNEKLIEEARGLQPTWHRGMYGSRDDMYANVKPLISRLVAALEAAEKAHTPTDDERPNKSMDITVHDVLGNWSATHRVVDALIEAGHFHRSEVPEPSAEDVAAEHQRHADARRAETMTLISHAEPQSEPSDAQVQALKALKEAEPLAEVFGNSTAFGRAVIALRHLVDDRAAPRAASAVNSKSMIECPHWSPGKITLRRGCTACAAVTEQGEEQNR